MRWTAGCQDPRLTSLRGERPWGVRALVLVSALALLGSSACVEEAAVPQQEAQAGPSDAALPGVVGEPASGLAASGLLVRAPSEANEPPLGEGPDAADAAAGSETGGELGGSEPGGSELGGSELGGSETGADASASAAILPAEPAPGSAEADAELLALLDDSTLTQDEFDKGFARGGAGVDSEQFVFGPDARQRGKPVVRLGKLTGPGAARLEALVAAESVKFERCLAMALSKDDGATGTLRLALEFDAGGRVSTARAEAPAIGGSAEIRASLTDCLRSIPTTWEVAEAAGSSAALPLTLSIDEA